MATAPRFNLVKRAQLVKQRLESQFRNAFSLSSEQDPKAWLYDLLKTKENLTQVNERLIHGLLHLVDDIEDAYHRHETEIKLRERSLNLSADELIDANQKIKQQLEHQQEVSEALRNAINRLLLQQGKPVLEEKISNIHELSNRVLELVLDRERTENEMLVQREAMDNHGIVVTVNVEGTILTVNDKCCALSGYSREELIGNHMKIFNVWNITKERQKEILKGAFSGEVWHGELHSRSKAGEAWYVSSTSVPIFSPAGRVNKIVFICTDITEHKRLEQKSAAKKRFYQSITNSIGEGVYAVDANGKTQFLNPEASRLLGWSLDELASHRFHDAVHYQKEDGSLLKREACPVNLSIRQGQPYSSDGDYFTDKQGRLFPISIVAVPLKNNHGDIEGHVGVFKDISDRKRAENRLKRVYEDAKKVSNAKSDFLATMSHEIRTPMNAIIGLSHLALETESQEQKQNYLEKVQGSATSLLSLINNILDFSKVENEEITLTHEPFTLHQIIEKLAQIFQHKARQKRLKLIFDIRLSLATPCIGDKNKIYQVLVNLIGNALKFTDKGFVKLFVKEKDNGMTFCVSDTGIGISDEHKEKLFNAFVQADPSISRKYGGTGLGLSICKRLVERMDGKLNLVSTSGEGSAFSFTLPALIHREGRPEEAVSITSDPLLCVSLNEDMHSVCDVLGHTFSRLHIGFTHHKWEEAPLPTFSAKTLIALSDNPSDWDTFYEQLHAGAFNSLNLAAIVTPLNTDEAVRRIGEASCDKLHIIELPFTEHTLLAALVPNANITAKTQVTGLESKKWRHKRLRNKHILLVDDDSISLEIAQQILLDSGIEVTTVADGEQALAACKKQPFDALLLDCLLPGISGFDVAEKLTSELAWQTPIIGISADATQVNIKRAISAGMCAHLLKPASAEEILHTIDIHIHRGYKTLNVVPTDDTFLQSLHQFYVRYSNANTLTQLINAISNSADISTKLRQLETDASAIGATTLCHSLTKLNAVKAGDIKGISDVSFAIDITLKLIAHTINLAFKPENSTHTKFPLNQLIKAIDSLTAYDAEALALLDNLYRAAPREYLHRLDRARQTASTYDYDSAAQELVSLKESLTNDE